MSYAHNLIDSIGNEHPRKNKYIVDLINASDDQRKKLIAEKNSHPYNIELQSFKEKENEFLLKIKTQAEAKYHGEENQVIKKLKERLYQAQEKVKFYEQYVELSYDAQLEYNKSQTEVRFIPEIIENDEELRARLATREKELSQINSEERAKKLKLIEEKTVQRKLQLEQELNDLKEKYNAHIISKKAFKNEQKIRQRSYKEDITAFSFIDDQKSIEEDIKSIKHHLKIDVKSKLNVLESDISDLRRKTPIELEKNKPIIAFFTLLFPGLGQFLNGQKKKALMFLPITLFTYFIAIPYALGYGNYQGKGFAGLVTLAQGGRKLDKSIMFMIEGIIAIVLVVSAILLLYISFKDVLGVEKRRIKGIRRNTWFETKQNIFEDGFPYLVSSPALVLIIFIIIVPVITTFLISFTNLDPSHQNKFTWIGIENYKLIFLGQGIAGKSFWLILGWTLIWTFGATTLAIAVGFILALIANQERIKGKAIFRTIYLLPWAVPAFITIMFFSLMVSRSGPITELITNVFGVTLDIKNDANLTRISLILLQSWLGSAYIFLLSTGVLQGIPSEIYEAAEVDGATGFQRTLKLTIPLVLFQISPLLISQYTFNFNNFSIIYLFNGGGPFNPSQYGNLAGSTDLLISYIYKLTIVNNYQAIGAAITIVISLVLMFFAYLGFRNTKAFKES